MKLLRGLLGGREFDVSVRVTILTVVLAACSLLYELTIAHTLSLLAANTVVWYSVTIGLYLLGMGTGSFVSSLLQDRCESWNSLIVVELLLSLIGGATVCAIHAAHMLYSYYYVWSYDLYGLFIFFGGAFFLTLLIGFLSGIELPLLIQIAKKERPESRHAANIVLGLDYIGSLLGAVLFPLFLVPFLDMYTISFSTASVNILVAIYLVLRIKQPVFGMVARFVPSVVIALSLLTVLVKRSEIEQYFLQKFYYYMESSDTLETMFAVPQGLPFVLRRHSPYQKIDLVQDTVVDLTDYMMTAYSSKYEDINTLPTEYMLFLNGDFQINSIIEEIYHEYFAHVPIMSLKQVPEHVLVLGGGDGLLLRELAKYKQIKTLTHVDLDQELIKLARTHPALTALNESSYEDPRVTNIYDDGYNWTRTTDRKFDAIYVDFPMPADYNLSKLYSREFFYFVSRCLKEGGFVVFDSTGTGALTLAANPRKQKPLSDNDWPIYYNTLKAAGYEQIVPYVTTLEMRNDEVRTMLRSDPSSIPFTEEHLALLAAARNSEERRVLEEVIIRSTARALMVEHSYSLQQGFIMAAKREGQLKPKYRDDDIELHVLNEERFNLAFVVDFPRQEQVQWQYVNSITKPRFPNTALWQPRIPY